MTIIDPVGVTEIAHRAQVKPETVGKWRQRHPGFPAPAAVLAMGPLWEWSAVAEWLAIERVVGRPRS